MKIVIISLLLSGCVQPVAFGTETKAAWCAGLLRDAPTASVNDTPQTKEEVANIGETIDRLCK